MPPVAENLTERSHNLLIMARHCSQKRIVKFTDCENYNLKPDQVTLK